MPMFWFDGAFLYYNDFAQRLCKRKQMVIFFAPADRMIMNYFVPVCPLLPSSAETAAVLRLPNFSVPACIMPYT